MKTCTTQRLKVIGFSVPATYADRVDAITRRERRTKRAVFEAMVDVYEETLRKREQALDTLVTQAIAKAEREKRTNPKTSNNLLDELEGIAKDLKMRTKKLGLKVTPEGKVV